MREVDLGMSLGDLDMTFPRQRFDDHEEIGDSVATVFVVEQNRDAQLRSLLILETNTDARKLIPVLHYSGMPIPSQCVVEGLCEHLCVEDVA